MAYDPNNGLPNPWTDRVRSAAKQQEDAATRQFQQGGWGAMFNQQNRHPLQSLQGLLAGGNQFFNPNQTAAAYSPEQVMAMQQQMPMRMGDTSTYAYQGNVYNAPGLTPMQMYNAMSGQQRGQVAQAAVGAGSGGIINSNSIWS